MQVGEREERNKKYKSKINEENYFNKLLVEHEVRHFPWIQ